MPFRNQVLDDLFQSRGVLVELPELLVGVASKAQGTAIGDANLVAIGDFYAFLGQKFSHRPNGVVGLRPAGDDDENVGRRIDIQLWH